MLDFLRTRQNPTATGKICFRVLSQYESMSTASVSGKGINTGEIVFKANGISGLNLSIRKGNFIHDVSASSLSTSVVAAKSFIW